MEIKLTLRAGADFSPIAETEDSRGRFPEVYDPELDNHVTILNDICESLEDSSCLDFRVTAFDLRWPTDATDFCIFLEQLPESIKSLEAHSPFVIEFYEQGIERVLRFEPKDDLYLVTCASIFTGEACSPLVEKVGRNELLGMLVSVRAHFLRYLRTESPHLAGHPLIVDFFSNSTPHVSHA